MAGCNEIVRQLERVRPKLVKELDINKLLPRLLVKRLFTVSEEAQIRCPAIPQRKVEVLLDILSKKVKEEQHFFVEFCKSLEECCPHLLTVIVLDSLQGKDEQQESSSQSRIKGDILLAENSQKSKNLPQNDLEQSYKVKDELSNGSKSPLDKEINMELNSSLPSSDTSNKFKDKLFAVETDQVFEETGPNVVWETHHITLHKAPVFGFGIAVSGGNDSPHFTSGDPSVAISDVIKAGPAEGKLHINDRIITVNGTSLENVDHNTAINVLRECGSTVNLMIKRRILLQNSETNRSNPPFNVTLARKNKKDEFGLVLGCKFFIREILQNSLASSESALHVGDAISKINDAPLENLSLPEVKKLIDRSKEKLQLTVSSTETDSVVNRSSISILEAMNNAGLHPAQNRDSDNINIFQPNKLLEEGIYVKDPTSQVKRMVPHCAYPKSDNTKYDGHYVLDNDPATWATLPRSFEHKKRDPEPCQTDLHDGYYSDQEDGGRGRGDFIPIQTTESYVSDYVFNSRSSLELGPRKVTFYKDRQIGLGLQLAGGNATGIFIASVQPGSAGEKKGLLEGDKIILANSRNMLGMVREEAVSYLASLEGQVTLIIQYKKGDYDRIMAAREAGDSFYIRTHFNYTATDGEMGHSFKDGDIFHVKDTLFRGIGGFWLAVKVSEGVKQNMKGTIPNSKNAEIIKSQVKEDGDKENFPNRRRGSLFRRKSFSRRSKSLGKDHWEQIVFAGLGTKFPAYERVVYREPGFVRPVVLFGAISDVARERLMTEYPDRFDFPQAKKSSDQGDKKDKNVVITLGSISEAVARRKHCLLDITPLNVDRLNYAQYNPIVIFLKAETKQSIKDIRGRCKSSVKSPRKLLEQSEQIEKNHSHIFTGQLKLTGTDSWFPRLCQMIEAQQRRKIWISEERPSEDMTNDLMFPMSSRLSCTTGASSNVDIARLQSQLDISPTGMQQIGRSSSDPSISTLEGITTSTDINQMNPSQDLRNPVNEIHQPDGKVSGYTLHPDNRYYPSYYSDNLISGYPDSRKYINPCASHNPAEKLHSNFQLGKIVLLHSCCQLAKMVTVKVNKSICKVLLIIRIQMQC